MKDYTTQVDVRAGERRRQLGDVGVIAGRYCLVLYGNNQKLELQSWQPEIKRTASIAYTWTKDTWYTLKLTVENLPDGRVHARGKVWLRGETEPTAWTIEKFDSMGNHRGSPGLFGDAPAEIYYDNLKVTKNK
jgi:hypothetical protein